jgi:hypothetical protein
MITSAHMLRRLDRALALWAALAAGLLFAGFARHGFDDPYITFRYATNLAAGAGFVYNPGLRVLSTTAPLYGLLLSPFAALGLPLPLVSMAIGAASHGLGALALYALGRLWQTPLAGLAAALIYPTFPLLVSALGGEAAFGIALVLWGFVAGVAGRWRWAAVCLAAAVVTRADALIAVACLGVYALLRSLQPSAFSLQPSAFSPQPSAFSLQPFARLPWGAALLGALLCAPWFLFAWIYYGAPTPVTLAAKQRQGLMSGSRSFVEGLFGHVAGMWALPTFQLLFVLAGVGVGYALLRHRAWLLIIGWSAAYGLAYSALGVTAYFWYYAPLIPGLAVAAGLGVQAVYDFVAAAGGTRHEARGRWHEAGRSQTVHGSDDKNEEQIPDRPSVLGSRPSVLGSRPSVLGSRPSVLGSRPSVLGSRPSVLGSRFSAIGYRLSAMSVAALLIAVVVGGQVWALTIQRTLPDARLEPYRAIGAWLQANTPPDAVVGALEVGMIGYYAERPMIDFAGLIQPDIALQLGPTSDYAASARWAIAQYRPDYLVLHASALPLAVVAPDGAAHCSEQAVFQAERYPTPLRIYHCVW